MKTNMIITDDASMDYSIVYNATSVNENTNVSAGTFIDTGGSSDATGKFTNVRKNSVF